MNRVIKKYLNIENIIIIGTFVFLLIRLRYGYCYNDEPFNLSLGQRLYKGDTLIVDEWNYICSFSVIPYLFYTLFRIFNATNQGIIIYFRICYVVIWFLMSLFVYKTFRPTFKYSIFIYLYLMLFSPYDNMTISYKSISLISCIMLETIIYSNKIIVSKRFTIIVMALLWVCLIISNPLMIIGFFCYMCYYIFINKKIFNDNIFFQKTYLIYVFLCAILLLFVYFCFSVLRGNSLHLLFNSIIHILNNPAHKVASLFTILYDGYSLYIVSSVFAMIGLYLIIFLFFKQKDYYQCIIYFMSIILFFIMEYVIFVKRMPYYGELTCSFNFEMISINILGIVSIFISKNKNEKLLRSVLPIAISYIFIQSICSDCGFREVCMSSVTLCTVSFISIITVYNEIMQSDTFNRSKLVPLLLIIVLFTQVFTQTFVKVSRQYWDESPKNLIYRIDVGAAKGIYTTRSNKEKYENSFNNMSNLFSMAGINIDDEKRCFVSLIPNPVIYLDADLEYGTFSSWQFGLDDKLYDRFVEYYSINKRKKPDIIFIEHNDDLLEKIDISKYSIFNYNDSLLLTIKE